MPVRSLRISDLFHVGYETLSPEQFLQLTQLKAIRDAEQSTENRAFVSFSMLRSICKNLKLFKLLTRSQIRDCFEVLSFLEDPFPDFIIKTFHHSGQSYINPGAKLENATFYQIVESDAAFTRYMISENAGDLDKFCTQLYRPVDGADEKSSLPDLHKQVIFMNYAACRQHFTSLCPNLFPPADNSEDPEEKKEPVFTGPMWLDLLYALADTPAFQGIEQAKNANFYEALLYLDKKAKENQEMKDRLDQLRKSKTS